MEVTRQVIQDNEVKVSLDKSKRDKYEQPVPNYPGYSAAPVGCFPDRRD
jgi:hypothetical protein